MKQQKSASEASRVMDWLGEGRRHPFLSPDYRSARFARRFFFLLSPTAELLFVLENEPIPNMCEQMILQEYVLQ